MLNAPFTYVLSPKHVQILHLGVNFVSDLAQVGVVTYIASCNILAVNNDPLEEFPKSFLCCYENKQLHEYMYGQGAQVPSIQIQ